MDPVTLNMAAAIASAVAAIASSAAAIASVVVAGRANQTAKETHKAQQLLQQRALIVDLWPSMCNIRQITDKTPESDVRDAVNILELVAICWEANAVDRDVIMRTFGDAYIATYNELMGHHIRLTTVRNRTGAELLHENRAAMLVYEEIKKRLLAQGKVT